MGQQSSAFVVEIANPRLGRFQAVPQKDPDEDGRSSEWRITVNPAEELLESSSLRTLLSRLYQQQTLVTIADCKQLLAALHVIDPSSELLLPLLTVISNCTARTGNQVLFRENALVRRVFQLMPSSVHWPRSCRIMLLQCLANMCGDCNNLPILQDSTPILVKKVSSSDETESAIAMQALTNLSRSIQPNQVNDYVPVIGPCLERLWIRGETNLNALRLLVNLACCPQLVPMILGSKPVMGLFRLLDCEKEEVLLRVLTWLLCLSSAMHALNITYDIVAPYNMDPFHNPSHTLYYSIYGPQGRAEMETCVAQLKNSPNLEISTKSERLLDTLKKIPRWPSATLNQL